MIYKFCNLILRNKIEINFNNGPIAQLAERPHGMREASGSNPLGSTNNQSYSWIVPGFYFF